MRQSVILSGSLAMVMLSALGCGSDTIDSEEPAGEASLEIKTVPASGVSCIAVSVSVGTQTTKKYLSVAANGSTASLSLGQLPLGSATITGNAYGLACTDSTVTNGTAQPSWVADPIIMKLQAGVVANVDLQFRRNSTVTVSANFVEGVKSISSQGMANVAVMADGTVKAWGGLLNGPDVIVPQAVASVPQVATACVGIDSYCALKTDGTVWCWGKNAYGQLGNGTTTDSTTPVRVTGLSNMTALACGGFYACAASEMTNNSAYCWGQNMWGQLGNGTTTSSSTPVQVYGGARGGVYKARRIAIGDSSTCYVSNEGRLACWGVNSHGQLGDATTVNSTTPVTGRLNGPIVDVALGDSHACALKADGSVYCWGSNSNGQLGNGDLSVTQSLTPVLVSGITGATKLAAGGATNCVKTQDGRAACWGRNTNGELGNATTIDSAVPVFVSGLTSVSNVAVGGTHTCAMTDNLSVYCWGANSVGELGTGDYNYSSLPKLVQMQ